MSHSIRLHQVVSQENRERKISQFKTTSFIWKHRKKGNINHLGFEKENYNVSIDQIHFSVLIPLKF